MVPYSITLSDLARHRAAELLVAKHLSYIGHAHEKTIQRDNIIVDVFKIICCSEPTDSFMVNVTVAQLPGHKVLQRGHEHRLPPPWHRHCSVHAKHFVLSVLILLWTKPEQRHTTYMHQYWISSQHQPTTADKIAHELNSYVSIRNV